MSDDTIAPSCTLHVPRLDAWIVVLTSHGFFCVVMGIPFAIWTYHVGRRKTYRLWCIPVAFLVAFSIPWYFHYSSWNYYRSSASEGSSTQSWMPPFLGSTFGFITAFKLWNVAFSQYPEGADATMDTFMNWFLLVPEPEFTKGKTRNLSPAEIRGHVLNALRQLGLLCVILSFLRTPPTAESSLGATFLIRVLQSFPSNRGSLWDEALNGWIHLWWLSTWVTLLLEISILISLPLTGCKAMMPGFRNPLTESRSFQEVWGTRWNLPVQVLLQRIAYVPLRRQGFSKPTAVMGTFLLSGLMHEYNFWTHNFVAYKPGIATIFFVAMGAVMLVEHSVWIAVVPARIRSFVQNYVPSALTAFGLTLISAIPVERYFIKSWLDAGMVETAALLFPHITCE